MIRINKPNAPAVLPTRGPQATRELCDAFDAEPDRYRRGELHFPFDDLYRHETVKAALLAAQHGKCAFCEAKGRHVAYGDVEHLRPKAAVVQQHGGPMERPGYYWLVYVWENLFFACQMCNQSFKRNLFPLRHPNRRARSHHDDIGREHPLLIDPSALDPAKYIGFRDEVAYAIRGNRIGRTTIEVLGLNRPELIETRRAFLDNIRGMREMLVCLRLKAESKRTARERRLLADLERFVLQWTGDAYEYSSMLRCFLK